MRHARFVAAALLTAATLTTTEVAAQADTPYLATIAIERSAGADASLGAAAVSTLHVNDPAKTVASLSLVEGIDVIASDEHSVRIRFDARPTLGGEPHEALRQSSWVVDYDEVPIRDLVAGFAARHAATPTPAELERFVYEHVHDKSYSRSFDLASRVAATGEGDCTEHAVLLAALARASGYAARVVVGNLILDMDTGLFAFGHAWTEIHHDGGWQIRDATLPGNAPRLRTALYIPLGSLANEGPSYVLSLVDIMGAMPVRITDVDSSGP
jgi:transglutaminase-like putative cysteine protease